MLTIQNLNFSYGMVSALHEVNMTMEPGKVTCVMGRNGVGKTTLMKNIIGLLRAQVRSGQAWAARISAGLRPASGPRRALPWFRRVGRSFPS